MKQKLFSTTTLWLLIFGLLNLFVSGRWTVAVAAWVAPIFALRYLYVHPQRRKFFYYFLVFWITLSIPWYGATPFFGPAHFIFMIVTALIGSVPLFVDRWLAPKLRRNSSLPFIATLIYPAAGTALELFTSSGSPLGNFGATGYSQYGIPVLTQITAITGMLGLTFLVSWFPAIVNWAWDNGFVWRRVRTGVAAFGVILLLVVGYGTIRLAAAPAVGAQESVTVASFTLVENQVGELNSLLAEEGTAAFRAETQPIHAQYLAKSEEAIAAGAEIILWPELAIIGVEEDVQTVLTQGQAMAQNAGVYLAMPVMIHFPNSDRLIENKLFVAGPDGRFVIEHTKYGGNLVEGTLAGSGEIQAVDTAYGTLAGIICWDTNFPSTVRQVGQQQTDILLSPSKEWDAINPMHAEMAVFRAIENGAALIRQTDEGLSIVVDGYGRTLASGEGLAADGNDLLVEVPTNSPTTIYPVIGDVVGIVATVGLVVLSIYALFIARRYHRREEPETAVAIP